MIARTFTALVCVGALLVGGFPKSVVAGSTAVAKKKKPAKFGDRDRAAGDKDGTNDVDGAIWKVVATNPSTGEKRNFGFRADDGVLYNRVGETVGSIKPIKKGESTMTWNENLPLEGSFKIVFSKVGHWGGIFKDKDGNEWRCRLDCSDR